MIFDLVRYRAAKKFSTSAAAEIIKDLDKCTQILAKHASGNERIQSILYQIGVNQALYKEFLSKAQNIVKLKGKI